MADGQNRKEINKALAKPLALTAGILGFVQGIAWTIFSILSICSYTGSIEIDSLNSNQKEYYKLIYLTFLNGDITTEEPANIIIKAKEFLIFSCFYLIFSIIWTCVSGTVTWTMIHDKWNLSKSLFITWSVVTILISIVDIVLMSLIITDYVTQSKDASTETLVCYGIVMSIAARGYVLWIINIVFAIILMKYGVDIILRENKSSTLSIIHGYETNDSPPWFNRSMKDFWDNTQQNGPNANGIYDNHGFERSQSFFTSSISNQAPSNTDSKNIYSPTSNNIYKAIPNNKVPISNAANNNPTSFSEAIANRTAKIGKKKNKLSPLNNIPPPVIPDPDYTPPNSPYGLKSVLRSESNYNQL